MNEIILLGQALAGETKDKRVQRALSLLLDHAVNIGSDLDHWVVTSATDEKYYHVTATSCDCPDHAHTRRDCKHVLAVKLALESIDRCQAVAEKHAMTISQVRKRLAAALSAGVPGHLADKILSLLIGAQLAQARHQLAACQAAVEQRDGTGEYKPKKIELIIRFRTTGGRILPTTYGGELVEVIEEGISRKPKTTDPRVAWKHLLKAGYTATYHEWLDRAGYMRRRKTVMEIA